MDREQARKRLASRIRNWKFEQALRYLGDAGLGHEARGAVEALGRMFGDVGWGLAGDMGWLVDYVVVQLHAELTKSSEGGVE